MLLLLLLQLQLLLPHVLQLVLRRVQLLPQRLDLSLRDTGGTEVAPKPRTHMGTIAPGEQTLARGRCGASRPLRSAPPRPRAPCTWAGS